LLPAFDAPRKSGRFKNDALDLTGRHHSDRAIHSAAAQSPTGYPIQSPYLAIANRQAEIMMRVASEFGFTPASRSRISAPPPDQLPLLDLAADEYEEKAEDGG